MDETGARGAGEFPQGTDSGMPRAVTDERANAARAQAIDSTFAHIWEEHLRVACIQAMSEAAGEEGLFEACRRAFREGYHVGAANPSAH